MKKRLLSLILILCLCAALLPVAVFAEDNVTIVTTEGELKDAIEKGGSIQLGADITLGYNNGVALLQIYNDVTLDLNGHILKADTGINGRFMIDVYSSHLTLTDSRPEAVHASVFEVDEQPILGGMIYGLRGNNQGYNECISVHSGATFTMQGGSIVLGKNQKEWNDHQVSPGGVYVGSNGTFNMTGGRIIGCSTGVCGGAVAIARGFASLDQETREFIIYPGGMFNMSGGSIENCHADGDGGGVYIEGSETDTWGNALLGGTFNMSGGTIKNCTAGGEGDSIYVADGAKAALVRGNIEGEITGNWTEYIPPVDPIDPDYPLISILPVLAKDLLFIDVKSTDWFYSDVKYAYETGLMTGTASDAFSPQAPVTRGMVMTILARREGIKTDRYTPWYAAGCEWAKANGISDGSNPEVPVTREQLAAMLYRYAALKGRDLTAGENLNFTDASDVSAYALPALQWATGEKILTGSNGALNPQAPATRAQLAAILHRYFR